MTDIYDQATHQEEIFRDAMIELARKAEPSLPQGACNLCGASCVGCFCDIDCQGQYEKEQRMAKINGRA